MIPPLRFMTKGRRLSIEKESGPWDTSISQEPLVLYPFYYAAQRTDIYGHLNEK